MDAAALVTLLRRHRFLFASESELQAGIADVLRAAGIPFGREVKIGERDRIDFLVGSVGVEVKINGSPENLIRQLHRYAQSPAISELLVVSSRCKLTGGLPETLSEKPIVALSLAEDFL
jgi:hypothetical protein